MCSALRTAQEHMTVSQEACTQPRVRQLARLQDTVRGLFILHPRVLLAVVLALREH
jgi:hypothetical protein